MKTIAIDLTPLQGQFSGIGVYVKHLMRAMLALPETNACWRFPLRGTQMWRRRVTAGVRQSLPADKIAVDYRWFPAGEFYGLFSPFRLRPPRGVRYDLYHITGAQFWFDPRETPGVVTVHDVAWLRLPQEICPRPPHLGLWHLPRIIRQARQLVCDSAATQRDVIELVGVPESRTSVVPLAGRPEFFPPQSDEQREACRNRLTGGRPYLLAVGTIEPRKNYPRLIEAFARVREKHPDWRLVIVGREAWGREALHEAIDRHRLADVVQLVGYVTDETVREYLWGAEAIAVPSLYEGFGLPVLEAMACGTPVIISSAGSLPEVAGNAALAVDPLSVDAITSAILSLAESPSRRHELRELGYAQAARFSWENTARLTWQAYERALA